MAAYLDINTNRIIIKIQQLPYSEYNALEIFKLMNEVAMLSGIYEKEILTFIIELPSEANKKDASEIIKEFQYMSDNRYTWMERNVKHLKTTKSKPNRRLKVKYTLR